MSRKLPPLISDLRSLLRRREHDAFLTALSAALNDENSPDRDVLRVMGGEGLSILVRSPDAASDQICLRYIDRLCAGDVDPAPGDLAAVTHVLLPRLAHCLDAVRTAEILRTLVGLAEKGADRERNTAHRLARAEQPPLQLRRYVQAIDFKLGDFAYSDALGLRQSVFKSPQERSFLRALSLRFPSLLAIPNYGLNQLFDSERLRKLVDTETWRFALRCVLDAVLVVPDEGDAVAAFELDSSYHDSPERQLRDQRKDELLRVIQIPLVRLRVSESASMTADEWYALLTDQVVDRISCGRRLTSRHAAVSLVPVHANR